MPSTGHFTGTIHVWLLVLWVMFDGAYENITHEFSVNKLIVIFIFLQRRYQISNLKS